MILVNDKIISTKKKTEKKESCSTGGMAGQSRFLVKKYYP
jgi:hypothetical protein